MAPLAGFTVEAIRYPAPEQFSFTFASRQTLDVYTGRAPIFLTLGAAGGLQPGRYALHGTLRIQICNDEICLPPSTLSAAIPVQVTDDPAAVRPVNEVLFAEANASAAGLAPTGGEATDAEAQIASMFGEQGLLLALMGVLVIGLALNLTPCVYPMLSLTVSLFGSREETRVGPSFGRSLVYVAGIVTMYSLLGAAAAYTGALFGSWLRNPWMLAGIGILLLVLALSMFGAYDLQVPAVLRSHLGSAHEVTGLFGLYLSGLVVGLFAALCIEPPIVGLLAFVGAQGDPLFAMSAFSTLGLGLGLPYLILGTFSGLLGRLPKSGGLDGLGKEDLRRHHGGRRALLPRAGLHPRPGSLGGARHAAGRGLVPGFPGPLGGGLTDIHAHQVERGHCRDFRRPHGRRHS